MPRFNNNFKNKGSRSAAKHHSKTLPGKNPTRTKTATAKPSRKKPPASPASVESHFARTTPSSLPVKATNMVISGDNGKNPRSPSSTEDKIAPKKTDSRNTPPRDLLQGTTITPDKPDESISPPPKITNKSDGLNTPWETVTKVVTSRKYKRGTTSTDLTHLQSTDDESDSSSTPSALIHLKNDKKLSTSILKPKHVSRGKTKEDALSFTDSSKSTDESSESGSASLSAASEKSEDTATLLKGLTVTKTVHHQDDSTVKSISEATSDTIMQDIYEKTPTSPPGSVNTKTTAASTIASSKSALSSSLKVPANWKNSTTIDIPKTATTTTAAARQTTIAEANIALEKTRSYDYLKEGKFATTKAYEDLATRSIASNKGFTHYEGLKDGTVLTENVQPDLDSIQDGITVNFNQAALQLLPNGWDDPEVTPAKLTEAVREIAVPRKPWKDDTIRQDARAMLIKLARTSPEIFDESWSYTTGFITNCKEGALWKAANKIYGSQWPWKYPNSLPKLPPKHQQKQKNRVVIPKSSIKTITAARGRFMTRPGGQQTPTTEQAIKDTSEKNPRNYQTFITVQLPAISVAGQGPGEVQALGNFNLAFEIILASDRTCVIYVWPLKFHNNRTVLPYSKKHLDDSYPKARKIESKNELQRYVSSAYFSEGNKSWLKMYCGHNEPIQDLLSDTAIQTLQDHQMNVYKETLQSPTPMICGWLLGAEPRTFNCKHFTDLLNSLPKFEKLPVACKKQALKKSKTEKLEYGEGTMAIVILCSSSYRDPTNVAMKATFNRKTAKAISERPDGANFKYIEYYADTKSKAATRKQLDSAGVAMIKQKKWCQNISQVRIEGIDNLDHPILLTNPLSTPSNPLPDIPTTCKQSILSIKCQTNYKFFLFSQIHEQADKSIIGICHKDQRAEAEMILGHLQVYQKEEYGNKIEAWYTQQAIDSAVGYSICKDTGQVNHADDDNDADTFDGFCTSNSPARTANAIANGTPLEDEYDGNLDDVDSDDDNEPELKIDMKIMFNTSNLGDGGGFDDGHSVSTQLTSVSQATALIGQIGGPQTNIDDVSTVTTEASPGSQAINTIPNQIMQQDSFPMNDATNSLDRTPAPFTNIASNIASLRQTGVQNDNQ